MDADKRLPTNQRSTTTDQEHETSPPGGMIDADVGLPRQAGWQGKQGQQGTQQGATALREQQAADLETVQGVAAKDSDKVGGGDTESTA